MWAWLKRTFGGGSAWCVPDQSQSVTLTPPAPSLTDGRNGYTHSHFSVDPDTGRDSTQEQHTPLPLACPEARVHAAGGDADVPVVPTSVLDTQTEEDQTPPLQVISAADRYIVSGGMPVGIANTVSKYRETQPLVPHLTPFEQRVAAKLTEEQQVAAAAAAAADMPDGPGGDRIKQKLFTAAEANRAGGIVQPVHE